MDVSGATGGRDLLTGYLMAREQLAGAARANGGAERIAALGTLHSVYEGELWQPQQAYRSDAPVAQPERLRQETFVDFKNRAALSTLRQGLSGGLEIQFTGAIERDQTFTASDIAKTYFISSGGDMDAMLSFPIRLHPVLLVRSALSSLRSAEYIAATPEGHEIAVQIAGSRVRLVVADDGAIVRALFVTPDRVQGQLVMTVEYEDYADSGHFILPRTVRTQRRDGVRAIWRLVAADQTGPPTPIEAFLERQGYRRLPEPGPELHQVAPGVYEIRGLGGGYYRMPVVERTDHLVVMDAPVNIPTTRAALALLDARFPEKPVRYVIVSHFHSDHTAGLSALAAAGATIVAHPEDRQFLARVVAYQTSLLGLVDLPPEPPEAKYLWVESQTELPGQGHRVTVVALDAIAHAHRMQIALIGQDVAVLEADLYSDLSIMNESFRSFCRILASRVDTSTLVLGVHHDALGAGDVIEGCGRASEIR